MGAVYVARKLLPEKWQWTSREDLERGARITSVSACSSVGVCSDADGGQRRKNMHVRVRQWVANGGKLPPIIFSKEIL